MAFVETQIALLRVLQEREFERVGGNQLIHADVRVITATNRDLQTATAAGVFRRDLFYRLNVFPIEIPALRQRKEDIPLLVEYFIDRYARKAGKKIRAIEKSTLELLQSYSWPGNIRELQNVIERSIIVCETETFSVDPSWLSGESGEIHPGNQPSAETFAAPEKEVIEAALAKTRGKVSGPAGAATALGIPASTLESKIRSLKINKFRFRATLACSRLPRRKLVAVLRRTTAKFTKVANATLLLIEPAIFHRLRTGGSIALVVEENFVENTMLRIQRSANGKVVFTLSGRIEAEDVQELHRLFSLETGDRHLVLDLKDAGNACGRIESAVKYYLARREARERP